MKKKYVLFDFDGVIADTEESNSHYLGLALKEFGVELTEKDKQRLIGTHDQELLIEFLSRAPRKVTVEQLTRRRKEPAVPFYYGFISVKKIFDTSLTIIVPSKYCSERKKYKAEHQ